MQIDKKENYTLISSDEKTFSNFYKSYTSKVEKFDNEHLILHISDEININNEDFLLFLSVSEEKKKNGMSFVIVNSNSNADDFPEHFNIVPTLQEAEDILEMEAIERELGF